MVRLAASTAKLGTKILRARSINRPLLIHGR